MSTPRTDAKAFDIFYGEDGLPENVYSPDGSCVDSNDMRDLERENARLREAMTKLMELESRGRIMPIGPEWDAARAALKGEG